MNILLKTPTIGAVVAGLFWAGAVSADVSTSGLIGLWHLDGNVLDSSGQGNHGTNSGATVIGDGVLNKAYRFDGADGIDVGNLDFTGGKYTVNIWLRTTRAGVVEDWRVAINKADTVRGDQTFEIYLGDGRAGLGKDASSFLVWRGGAGFVNLFVPDSRKINARDGTWHMATATYQAGQQRLYVDGQLQASADNADPPPIVGDSVIIGGRDGFGPYHHPWIGDLDEVSIYTRVLSAAEVRELFEKSSSMVPRTGQTIANRARDDGALKKGRIWPNPRFRPLVNAENDSGIGGGVAGNGFCDGSESCNGSVLDRVTNLVWLQNADCFDLQNWTAALTSANGLTSGQCGLTDGSRAGAWRLPNIMELQSLVARGCAVPALSNRTGTGCHDTDATPLFSNVVTTPVGFYYYWSSTSRADVTDAWMQEFSAGITSSGPRNNASYLGYVWPVRDR